MTPFARSIVVWPLSAAVFLSGIVPLAAASDAGGQDSLRHALTPAAIRRAVDAERTQAAQLDPRAQWSRVERLAPGTDVTVVFGTRPSLHGAIESADGSGLSLRLTDTRVERIDRADVLEVRALGRRRGSTKLAVVGAAAGALLGFVGALHLAFAECGGNCSDEKFLMGLSLVGAPVAGGFIGYYGGSSGRRSETVYVRP